MKIAIGGMIASGKSTLVKQLAKKLGFPAMDEFADEDVVFNTLLGWLYEGVDDVEMLLQVYFLHKHWKTQNQYQGDVVVDRHIVEHWLFAQENLQSKKEVLNMYNGLFHQYMNDTRNPDLYIILDMDWKTFEERMMKRGRQQEVENFEKNKDYFKSLMKNYVPKLTSQCIIYDIPFVVINTTGMTEQEVLDKSMEYVLQVKP